MLHLYQDKPIGGADILNSLADVNINNPENKQIIYYDQATGTWRNYDPPFVNSENVLHTVEECAASTNPEDVAGASVASSLNSALEWKTVGEAFGNVNISLPADWRELAVVARYGTSGGLQSQTIPFRLTRMSKGLASLGGSGAVESQVFISNDASTISLIYFAVSGTAYTATSKIYVIYR